MKGPVYRVNADGTIRHLCASPDLNATQRYQREWVDRQRRRLNRELLEARSKPMLIVDEVADYPKSR